MFLSFFDKIVDGWRLCFYLVLRGRAVEGQAIVGAMSIEGKVAWEERRRTDWLMKNFLTQWKTEEENHYRKFLSQSFFFAARVTPRRPHPTASSWAEAVLLLLPNVLKGYFHSYQIVVCRVTTPITIHFRSLGKRWPRQIIDHTGHFCTCIVDNWQLFTQISCIIDNWLCIVDTYLFAHAMSSRGLESGGDGTHMAKFGRCELN